LRPHRDGTGVAFDSSTGFLLSNGAERSPDAAWVLETRWDALSRAEQEKLVPLCPDFVLELRSPSDTVAEQEAKMEEYMQCGARLGWLLDPEARRIHVYRPRAPTDVLDEPSEVAVDPVLSGFVLELRTIW
jgi:Uma2 family endonuclease